MPGISDRLNWDLVGRANYITAASATNPDTHVPIPTQQMICDRPIILVGCNSVSALPHWRLGCWISQRLIFTVSNTSEYLPLIKTRSSFPCELNTLSLISFPDYQISPYLLLIDIPRWLKDLSVEVWKYSGEPFDPIAIDLEAIKANLGI